MAGTVRKILAPNGTLNAIFTPLNNLLSLLFNALSSVLVITINAQNDGSSKDPFSGIRVPLPVAGPSRRRRTSASSRPLPCRLGLLGS